MSNGGSQKNYSISRIEIEERDPSVFADLTFFFDREDALNDIAVLRKAWIGDTLVPHDQIDEFINKKSDTKEANKFWNEYWPWVYRIARKYGLRNNFIRPIVRAVLSGIVVEGDYFRAFEQSKVDNLSDDYKLSEKEVVISNFVRDIDLHGLSNKIDDKSVNTIRRDREWYWLYQKMGYRKIAKLKNQTLTTVISAIKSYSLKLQTYYSVTK